MKDTKDLFNPGDEDLPEGWGPEIDDDPVWKTINRLMRESDAPARMPNPAMMEAVRMESRRALLAEGLLKPNEPARRQASESDFLGWLRTMLFGGGAGGQLVRLGVVGGFAFFAGSGLMVGPNSSSLAESRTSTTPIADVAPEAKPEIASIADTSAAPRTTGGAAPLGPMSTVVERGMGGGNAAWESTAAGQQAWMFPQRSNGAVSAVPVAAAGASVPRGQQELAGTALDGLQRLKFYSLMDQNDRYLAEIRRIEQTLSRMVDQPVGEAAPNVAALERYNRGEQALAARRYTDAQQLFAEAAGSAPGTILALLSDYQIAQIAFEHTQDYEQAVQAYRRCIDMYPPQMLTDQARGLIQDRLNVLMQGQADQWASLQQLHIAERSQDPAEATRILLGVVSTTPSMRLAQVAAEHLKNFAIRDVTSHELDHTAIVTALENRVASSRPSPETASIQFAIAEIVARRGQDLARAMNEYRKAGQLGADPRLNVLINQRTTAIMNQRLVGFPAPE